ncbi:unnamed protein product [Clonostachys solani]|uniref:Uncharacterized protein n=1 Tax=Clonostachys solani TaxID=160281 RepID=A0A9N9ZNP5_9HYPO|nr:unnamed protein product [Clonostachys solani]
MAKSLIASLLLASLARASDPAGLPEKKDQDGKLQPSQCQSVLPILPKFTFGPTRTVFTTTTTHTSTVDCGICEDVVPVIVPLGIPPVVLFTATTTASTPYVTTEYECGSTPAPSTTLKTAVHPPKDRRGPPSPTITSTTSVDENAKPISYFEPDYTEPEGPTTVTPPGIDKPECTSSTALDPVVADSTWTFYPSTVTSTSSVDCGECALEWSTGVIYYFAPILYTATTTAATPSVKVDLACLAVPTKAYIGTAEFISE